LLYYPVAPSEAGMLVHKPTFTGPRFWVCLAILGLLTEAAVLIVAGFWATRHGADSVTMGPVLFALSLACLYVSSQILTAMFAIDTTAGMSLSLLAAMVAWLAALGLLLFVGFLMLLAVYSLVGVPARLAVDVVRRFRLRSQ
jgi:hypothetical protein